MSLLAASSAAADPAPEITVVAGPRAALAHRLAQELEASGLVVHVEDAQAADAPKLFVVVPEDAKAPIEIWTTKDGVSSLLATVASDGPADTRVLRAAEIARALAAPDGAAASPASAQGPDGALRTATAGAIQSSTAASVETPPPSATAKPAATVAPSTARGGEIPAWATWPAPLVGPRPQPEPTPPSFDFGFSVALGLQTQGASLQIEGSARWWPAERFGVGVLASAPVVGALVETTVGDATVRSSLFGLELETAPITRTGAFAWVLSPGIGLDWIHVDGTAKSAYESLGGDGVQAAIYARTEVRIAVTGPLRLSVGAMGGAALPPVDITFIGTAYSTYSAFGSASFGAEIEP
ncbi:MAG TPA: hypothetical protein VL400_03495 [Polyangiaceae bacterium]|nr:hypothetical protein [Polyangiaceae bacterium]